MFVISLLAATCLLVIFFMFAVMVFVQIACPCKAKAGATNWRQTSRKNESDFVKACELHASAATIICIGCLVHIGTCHEGKSVPRREEHAAQNDKAV